MKHTIHIMQDGTIKAVGGEQLPLAELGQVESRRASRILPVNIFKRCAFIMLRKVFGDRGRVATFTRSWSGPWQVRVIGSPRQFTAPSRRLAIAWEQEILNEGIENE